MDFYQESDSDNQYFFEKMFTTCAKAMNEQNITIPRLYETEWLEQLRKKTSDSKSKVEIQAQILNAENNNRAIKGLYFMCFNRFFFAYNILKEVGFGLEEIEDDDDEL